MTSLQDRPSETFPLVSVPMDASSLDERPLTPSEERRRDRADETAALFSEAAATSDPEVERRLLDRIVVLNLGLATAVVARFRSRGIPTDDLLQVARLALVKASRRFDRSTGSEFVSFAVPTIRGEVKRHFRDAGWMVRPPRRVQELQARISPARNELANSLGRDPEPRELASALEVDLRDVTEAMSAHGCFVPASLDVPVGEDASVPLGDVLSSESSDQPAAEARVLLGPLVRQLGDRDRRVLQLRFFDGLTQREIADDIGVTQMQVSRLLARILGELRTGIGDMDAPDAAPTAPPAPGA
ncbi:RNA polymerase sigma-B factor [Nocardioides scoriae]|uniref:RNA polymerase sigma-B factor n=2 Tax=Nocardioides scoriae TaxID=642780 RepID=A0A1H1XN45_9ACTN|nr:RNA polymerase sigma-B factor [Nocardioides scoriae]